MCVLLCSSFCVSSLVFLIELLFLCPFSCAPYRDSFSHVLFSGVFRVVVVLASPPSLVDRLFLLLSLFLILLLRQRLLLNCPRPRPNKELVIYLWYRLFKTFQFQLNLEPDHPKSFRNRFCWRHFQVDSAKDFDFAGKFQIFVKTSSLGARLRFSINNLNKFLFCEM